jgi:hypothetical protein
MDRSEDSKVTVTSTVFPAEVMDRARAVEADLVVLPRRWAADGRGVYGEATLFLVKELRADGVNAAYLESGKDRLFEVKKSALLAGLATIGFGIGAGIGTNAAWAGIKRLLTRHADDNDQDQDVEVAYVDLSASGNPTQYTVRGPAHRVVDTIEQLRKRSEDRAADRNQDDADGDTTAES